MSAAKPIGKQAPDSNTSSGWLPNLIHMSGVQLMYQSYIQYLLKIYYIQNNKKISCSIRNTLASV